MGMDPISGAIGSALLGQVIGGLFGKKQEPQMQIAATPATPAPQASVVPDIDATRRQVAGTTGAGESSTLLTGIGGVDPKKLSLGKATLLGD